MNNIKNIPTMKKTAYFTLLCALISFSSCDLFKVDNYELPKETIQGEVIDAATGAPVLTDQGGEGIRVRLTELSWGDNVTPNPDFFCKPDGTFQNTKIFEGTYKVEVDGPFIPLVRKSSDNVLLADESQTVEIKGTTKVLFEVQPFLNVEWVSDPMVSNGKISARVKVTRAVSVEDFRAKVEPMGNYNENFTNITDIQLFVSYSSSVGYRARDSRWSNSITYAGAAFESLLGTPVTIESLGNIPSGQTVFVRAAARINYATAEVKRWNYSEPVEVYIP